MSSWFFKFKWWLFYILYWKNGYYLYFSLYNQKKNINQSIIKRNSISSRDKALSQFQSQKHIISVESFSEIDELDSKNRNDNHIIIQEKNLRRALQNHFLFRDIIQNY